MFILCFGLIESGPPTPRFEKLDNGLSVVVVEDHALSAVSVQLWYMVGQTADPPRRPGLCAAAHRVLEQHVAARQQSADIISHESKILRDACYFASVVTPRAANAALDVEAARMQPVSVTPNKVKVAAGAAARAYSRQADDPDIALYGYMSAVLFPGNVYQHPPGFVAESTASLAPDEIDAFLQRWFVPSNAMLFVTGAVSADSILEHVRPRCGKIESPPRRNVVSRSPAGKPYVSVAAPDGERIALAWQTPPLGYFENAAIDVLMHRLCNPIDGPLHRRLTESGCAPPRWKRSAWRDAGMLVLAIGAGGDAVTKLDEVEASVHEEIQLAGRTVPEEIEHDRARALARRQVLEGREHFHNRAVDSAAYHVITGELSPTDYAISRLGAVGVRDVQQAAGELIDAMTAAGRRSGKLASPPLLVRPLNASVADVGAPLTPSSYEIVETVEHEIRRGLQLVVRRTPGRGLAKVQTFVRGAHSATAVRDIQIAPRTARLSSVQLRDYLSYHGLDLVMGTSSAGETSSRPSSEKSAWLCSRGPISGTQRMIGLHSEVIRRSNGDKQAAADQIRPVKLVITGDMTPDDILAAAREVWSD